MPQKADDKYYQTGVFVAPSHDIDPKNKDAYWCAGWAEFVYAEFLKDRCWWRSTNRQYYDQLRSYGAGKQSIDQYKNLLLDAGDISEEEKKGYMNLSWEIMSVAPKFRSVVQGIVEGQGHSFSADSINPMALDEKERKKWAIWVENKFSDELEMMDSAIGLKPQKKEFETESLQELEMYMATGGVKLAEEIAIEMGLDYIFFTDNDWVQIKRRIIGDIFDLGMAVTKDYIDPTDQRVKLRYVDPLRYVTQYSRFNDFRDSEYGGEIIPMTITDLRKRTDLEEEELRGIAEQTSGRYGNRKIDNWSWTDLMNPDGSYQYDDYMVNVLDCEWLSIDSEYSTRRTNKRGQTFEYPEKWGVIRDSSTRNTTKAEHRVVYSCKWIIGSEHVFEWGKQKDIPRVNYKDCKLSFHAIKIDGQSKIELIKQNLDQIQLVWLKLQNAIAQAAPAGIAIQWDALDNMAAGGNKLDPMDILTIRRQAGDLLFKSTTHRGMPTPGGQRPIVELEGGLGRTLPEALQLIEYNIEMIRNITGVNKIADASTPDPSQSVRGSQMAVSATSNALRPLYGIFKTHKEQVAKNCAIRLKDVVSNSKQGYDNYYGVIGKMQVDALVALSKKTEAELGITIEARPTDEEKAVVEQAAIAALKPDRNGNPGLEMSDFLLIERILNTGNIKFAAALLTAKEARRKKDSEKQAEQNMVQQQQMQTQLEGKKTEDFMMKEKFTTDQKIRLEMAKGEVQIRVNNAKQAAATEGKVVEQAADTATKAALEPPQGGGGAGAEEEGMPPALEAIDEDFPGAVPGLPGTTAGPLEEMAEQNLRGLEEEPTGVQPGI